MADTEDDPYAVSSDSEDEDVKKPPPKIAIEGRASDLSTLKAALASENEKEVTKDQSRAEEIKELKAAISQDLNNVRSNFESGNTGVAQLNKDVEEKPEREKLTAIDKEKYSQFKDKFEKLDETLEQNLEEKRKAMEREIYGAGAEGLSKAKDRFEKPQEESEIVREAIDIQRSDADKKRVQKAFNKKSVTEEDVPKECVICGKVVYPVEKVFANKRLYHKACFKCSKCNKSLTATNFNSHEGALLCKVHHLEVFHPELAKSMDPTQVEEEEHGEQADDEEGDYAVVSKPKVLDSSVVRSGLKSTDDLATISSLRDKKGSWETSVQESQKAEKKTVVEGEMFQTGRVKSHQTKFTEGGSVDEPEEEEDESTRDPNVIRENRRGKKEELHFEQVGDIKNKWKTGGVEAAQENREDRSSELDELKKGLKVKERFQEKSATDQADAVTDRQSVMEKESIDTSWTFPAQEHPVQALLSFMRMRYVSAGPTPPPSPSSPFSPTSAFAVSSEARKAFLQGGAFETGPVEKTVKDDIQFSELGSFKERFEKGAVDEAPTEKTAIDVQCGELGNIKAAFEKGDTEMTPEDRAEEKKKQIEAEFTRYKLARRKQELREERERQEGGDAADKDEGPADVRSNAEVGSIKERFEQGTAFKSDEPVKRRPEDEIEIKVAGKARQKFKEIDADGTMPIRPTMQSKPDAHISKWGKDKDAPVPEAINRRVRDDSDDQEEDEGAFEVKALMNKFKNIAKGPEETDTKPKPRKQFTPPPEGYKAEIESSGRERDPNVVSSSMKAELEGLGAIEAKELKARFEGKAAEDSATETVEEKRKRLEEEFKKYKQQKEIDSQNEPAAEEEAAAPVQKEEIQVAADHASKMAAKWEKIQKKEAKKAQKSQMPQKPAHSVSTPPAKICFACSNKVYMAERLECDGMLCHRMCFRCKVCLINLRVENYARGPDGIYCKNHHKERFNDMSKSAFVYSATREFVCSA